jgi:phosphatidylglycerol---prolipoprotein diacylglyceryl transferase
VWYVALYRRQGESFIAGLCIQGFIAGAVVAGGAALLLLRLPMGTFADAVAPGLFLGMSVGRLGCFFGGCCAGRPTTSRWGLWASNRRIGAHRIPTQLMESLICLAIGALALALVVAAPPRAGRAGTVFVGAVSAYTICRQLLLPFRAEPRKSALRWRATMAAAVTVLAADVLVATVI